MKKLLFLSVFALVLFTTNVVFGQGSTGITPSPGATHSYSVATHSGSTYAWTVTKGNLTTTASTDAVIGSTSTSTTDITWAASVTAGTYYYVHMIETAAGCSNEKVLPVLITASPFTLALAAANATSCYNGAVSVSLNGNDVQYDHGNTTIVYTVTPSGLSSSYSGYAFNLDLTVPSGYTSTVAFSPNASITAGVVTSTNNSPVTITYTVDNTNVYTNVNDAAGTAADFTATAKITLGKAKNGVSDNETGIDTGATAVSRPHTTGIQTN